MIKINVITNNTNWLRYIKEPNNYLERKIKKINSKEKRFDKKSIFCTLLLSGNKEIKNLNKKFRNKNKSTDILSFPHQTKKELKKLLIFNSKIYLGDIIINFRKINTSSELLFKSHFNVLWIHGLVHLFGYDHKKDVSYKQMQIIEKKFLRKIS